MRGCNPMSRTPGVLSRPLVLLLALLVTLLAPESASSQSVDGESRYYLEVAGGLLVPIGDAARAAETGLDLSLGFGHRLGQRISLITEVHVAGFFASGPPGDRAGTTDLSFLRIVLGVDAALLSPLSPWHVSARLTGGISNAVSDPVGGVPSMKLLDDAFVVGGGLQVGRAVGPFAPFVRGEMTVYFVGSELAELQSLDEDISSSGPLIGFPIQVGLRFRL